MASYSTLLVPIINEILVKEIGEANVLPLKWTKVSPYRYKFLVDIGDFTEVAAVDFEDVKEHIRYIFPPVYSDNIKSAYNIAYNISGDENQYAKTNLKTLLTIMSTVVDIVKDFVKQNKPDGLFIKGTSKKLGNLNNTQKNTLYDAYIKSQLKNIPEYKSGQSRGGFIIVKNECIN
jgi:hypothetical protein